MRREACRVADRVVPTRRLQRERRGGRTEAVGPSIEARPVLAKDSAGERLGKYFSVWQKQNTGEWRYIVD